MAKEDKVKHLILACRYYNGEDDNPFVHEMEEQGESDELNDAITAWNYECYWVNEKHGGNDFKGYLEDFAHAFSEFKADDTPTDLIAVLWNRYQQWVSDGPEGFTEWYTRRYQSRETNRQRRANGIMRNYGWKLWPIASKGARNGERTLNRRTRGCWPSNMRFRLRWLVCFITGICIGEVVMKRLSTSTNGWRRITSNPQNRWLSPMPWDLAKVGKRFESLFYIFILRQIQLGISLQKKVRTR